MSKRSQHYRRRIQKEWDALRSIRKKENVEWPALSLRIVFCKAPEELR